MEVEDPELGLEERDNEPGLEWDSESKLGLNKDELSIWLRYPMKNWSCIPPMKLTTE
jgi:hypothetical protein